VPADIEDNSSARLSPRILRRLLRLVKPFVGGAVIVLVLIGLQIGIQMGAMNVMRLGVNKLQGFFESRSDAAKAAPDPAAGRDILAFLFLLAGGYVALFGGNFLVFNVMRIARTRFSMDILWHLRNRVYGQLQRLSFRFFDTNYSGELINRATGDINTIRRFFMMALFNVVTLAIYLAAYLGLLLAIRWDLALVCMAPLPISIALLTRFGRRLRVAFHAVRSSADGMVNALQENVAGVKVVKAFAREKAEIGRYQGSTGTVFEKVLRTMRLFRNNLPLIGRVSQISQLVMLFYGGAMVMDGRLKVGDLLMFSAALSVLMEQLRMVVDMTQISQEAAVSAQRVFEIIEASPEVADKPRAPALPDGRGRVVFEDVTFGYDPKVPVLHGIDLAVEPGQIVALVGPTGSGKSTLTNLIPRFYDPQRGRVMIDGVDVRDVRLRSLRDSVGMVFQETFLFSASIAENIAYGSPKASMDDVRRAAAVAHADEFIEQLDEGYDTIIGERGVTLSGGQRQRLAIARAILKNPRVLILDDATASVDAGTEQGIQEALEQVMRGRTTFVIAHRIGTLRLADLVVVIEDGRITQRGTHAELFRADGHFRRAYLLQMKEAHADLIEDGAVGV
jgi:ABC-type multidrug transport system fused ATPase/permease subunit